MSNNGLTFNGELIADGLIHRYSCDAKRNPDEWYCAFQEGDQLTCAYGSWSTGEQYVYSTFKNTEFRTNNELKQRIKNAQKAAYDKRRRLQLRAADSSRHIWGKSSSVYRSSGDLDYLRYKRLELVPELGVRFGDYEFDDRPCVIIPMVNMQGSIMSLQYIHRSNGETFKRFKKDGQVKDLFHVIGVISDKPIYFVEGFATGATVHKVTKCPVVVAFSCHNLCNVMSLFQAKYKNELIVAADLGDAGEKAGERARGLFGCQVIYPVFKEGVTGTDFNDLYIKEGESEVMEQLKQQDHYTEDRKAKAGDLLNIVNPCEDLDLSLMPHALREHVEGIKGETESHEIMLLMASLASISGILNKHIYIEQGKTDGYFQRLYPVLWMVAVTESGSYKSTALNKGMSFAEKMNSDIMDEEDHLLIERENEKNKDTIKDIDNKLMELSRLSPILPDRLTGEALIRYLAQGHSGFIRASEFSVWLQNLSKTHNNDLKGIFTDFFDVPVSYRYSSMTHGNLRIRYPFISICGVTTIDWLADEFQTKDHKAGFYPRFLFFVPPLQNEETCSSSLPELIESKKSSNEGSRELNAILQDFVDQVKNGTFTERVYRLAPESKPVFNDMHNRLFQETRKLDEKTKKAITFFFRRWSPYILKLSMIMQFLNDPYTNEIEIPALEAAMNIIQVAFSSTVHLYEGELVESEQQSKIRQVLDYIARKIRETGKPLAWKALLQSRVLGGGHKDYEYIIKTLEDQGRVSVTKGRVRSEDTIEIC